MSLRLRQAVAGRPSRESKQCLDIVKHDDQVYIAYTSSSNVVLVSPELVLSDTLDFWSALPPRAASSSNQRVQGVRCVDGLIIAWSGIHVVAWQRAIRGKRRWDVSSTLVAGAPVTTLDLHKGALVLGTLSGIECWHMNESDAIVIWDRIWARNSRTPTYLTIAPNTGHLAWYRDGDRSVHILPLNGKAEPIGVPQELKHPREISHIMWRRTQTDSDDSHLYTITECSVFRIYSPVLDDPSWFQLLLTIDSQSFAAPAPKAGGKGKMPRPSSKGVVWPLDAHVLWSAVLHDLDNITSTDNASTVSELLESLAGDESDVVAWIGDDGDIAFRSIMNMDRKPPTLLKTLALSRLKIDPSVSRRLAPGSRLLLNPKNASLLAVTQPDSGDDNQCLKLTLPDILASRSPGIIPGHVSRTAHQLSDPISHFVRTPNGRGLLAVSRENEVAVWYADRLDKPLKSCAQSEVLLGRGIWTTSDAPIAMAIFAKGRAIVTYSRSEGKPTIVLQHLDEGRSLPSDAVTFPDFDLTDDDEIQMLLAVSDIDDGYSARGRRTQKAYIMAASRQGHAWVWKVDSRLAGSAPTSPEATTLVFPDLHTSRPTISAPPDIARLSRFVLPVSGNLAHVLPVDPMGWHQSVVDWKANVPLQDMILTISKDGTLEFWRPALGHHFDHEHLRARFTTSKSDLEGELSDDEKVPGHTHEAWSRTGSVRTGICDPIMARCSSRKKTVIIREKSEVEHEMTIWDSNTSEFSTGLELTHCFLPGEKVQDLDWTTTSDLQSVLAVGFEFKVVLVCEQRMSYDGTSAGWAPFMQIDMTSYSSIPISDSIWLAEGSLAVGAGNQIYLFSRFLDRDTPAPTPAASLRRAETGPAPVSTAKLGEESDEPEDLFQLIAYENGPLWDYHPTMLSQCLLWNKIDLVKRILLNLLENLKHAEILNSRRLRYKRLEPSEFLHTHKAVVRQDAKATVGKYEGLFDTTPTPAVSDGIETSHDEFDSRAVNDLIDRLDGPVRIPLNKTEKVLLGTVARAVLEVDRQRRALDICGLRYLLAVRMFVNHARSTSGTSTPMPNGRHSAPSRITSILGMNGLSAMVKPRRSLLSFRNVVWAMHSESQDMLLSAATETCDNGKMLWEDASSLGVFCWLKSTEIVKAQLEVVARNRFMSDDDRDPTTCSLIFFALGKRKVVHGLWRQAPGHREQSMMLKFLANDFDLERWRTAAVKNAYALLSKQRYEYAAAFFMLAGQPKDATNIILRHLDDWQLAFALAHAVEGSTDGPIVKSILHDVVLPRAFQGGHRWLASWGFWVLGRRDLSVRVLISPIEDVASSAPSLDRSLIVGDPANDDPSLLLLFQHLKSKSLQTAKGTNEIPEKTEFDFVLHNARVFFRLGCHPLGLDLLHSWSFDRPFFPVSRTQSQIQSSNAKLPLHSSEGTLAAPQRPGMSLRVPAARARRTSFMLNHSGREASMVMDMDMQTLTEGGSGQSSRMPSPPPRPEANGETGAGALGLEIGKATSSSNGPEQVSDPDISGDGGGSREGIAPVSDSVEQDKPKKIGNLMKELQADVQQGAQEFNMDNFF
ncbi:RAVE protein 1 C terminal-domain-containing protein [Kockovaella imperatae]|uniref:RAVE protein 1 C terminal-domain-containing protein n=1 Tax=Kockovaella imperatae TaxID=4999 RepID=A0A1Y1U7V1_9TREE|nr:RAVE protein 1 C terminal-domain-containing protein [Kockovaella imperatae]ORX33596.1 RAVE protein 1 C terminal-domain-containing protein [Kockovaella imperatae]